MGVNSKFYFHLLSTYENNILPISLRLGIRTPIQNGGIIRIWSCAATLGIDGAAVRSTRIITLLEVI